MYQLIKQPEDQLRILFRNTAQKTGLHEDIDLILDWRVLGYGLNEPWKQRSNTKQDAFNKEANSRAKTFLSEQLLPVLKEDMSKILGKEASFYILPEDPQTICFQYPKIFSKPDTTILTASAEMGAL